jgi:hypothetical protein
MAERHLEAAGRTMTKAMKTPLKLICMAAATLLLAGCASTHTRTAHHETRTISLGEDSFYELTAQNLTRGEVTNPLPPVVVLNPKGTKVLAAFPADPLAGIITAQNLQIKVGKQQSNAFGKAIGALNNLIMGWTAVEGLKAATAQRASDNALRAKQAQEATAQTALQTAPTKYLPAEGEAISRAGGTPFIP